ncbi:MAG: hypothetical protein KDE22_14810 [Rhodobacterales bacterium]|nr:hypothetical protein [Rhodobacterales bacterium]
MSLASRRRSWMDAFFHSQGEGTSPRPDQGARANMILLDEELHAHWRLGRDVILVWTPRGAGLDILVVPHYRLADFAIRSGEDRDPQARLIDAVVAGPKQVSPERLADVARVLDVTPQHVDLPFTVGEGLNLETITALVRRYSISHVQDRAVALFDAVGFSLLSPLEQVTQLNSLAYSVNSAHSKLMDKNIQINFGRTTTGDGFYIWNRATSIQANVDLYHFMHLVLADNAIARRKAKGNTAPLLRASFHVGGHYEFYQSEGLSPTTFSYIVGDVTIELARILDHALPGQVLVGDFRVPMPDRRTGRSERVDTLDFIHRTQGTLSSLEGLVLAGDGIDAIKCYLTGPRRDDGLFGVRRYSIGDKHGLSRDVYNAKINIYRKDAEPIFLGIQEAEMSAFRAEAFEDVAIESA